MTWLTSKFWLPWQGCWRYYAPTTASVSAEIRTDCAVENRTQLSRCTQAASAGIFVPDLRALAKLGVGGFSNRNQGNGCEPKARFRTRGEGDNVAGGLKRFGLAGFGTRDAENVVDAAAREREYGRG